MYPSQHIILGAVFSAVLFLIFPTIGFFGFLIIFLSSFLIDVDHYLYYVYKKKDLSLKRAYLWFMIIEQKWFSLPKEKRNNFYDGFYFFHGIEFLIVIFFFSLFFKFFLFIFIGLAFHLILDIINQTVYWDRFDKVSLIYDFIKFKKLKNIE